MRLSITVLCTLALALVARGIPVPTPPSSDDGHTTPPEAPHNPTTQASTSGSGGGHQQQHQSTAQLGPNYTPRTAPVHRGSVSFVAPSDYNPPGDNRRPHPFIAANSPSPGGTTHGFGATHGIIGTGQNNREANHYLPPGHPTAFQPNQEGHPTLINVHNRHETNTAHMYDSRDHRLPTQIPPHGMTQLEHDHAATQRGSTTRPRVSRSALTRALSGITRGGGRGQGGADGNHPESSTNNRGRGRGRGRGGADGNHPESSTSNHGHQATRGSSRGGGGPSRSSSRGSNTSRRGASADSKGEHRQHPYSRDKPS